MTQCDGVKSINPALEPLVSDSTNVEDAKICQGNFVVVHVHGKKIFCRKELSSHGNYISW